jgi:hypothetical protein
VPFTRSVGVAPAKMHAADGSDVDEAVKNLTSASAHYTVGEVEFCIAVFTLQVR